MKKLILLTLLIVGCEEVLEPEDACGVAGGDGTTCADCAGVSNGDAVEDDCGVCDGIDGYIAGSCYDCADTPNGDAELDECGVCDGIDGYVADSCYDCADTPNGDAVEDECGVCEGNGIIEGTCDCDGTLPEQNYDCDGNCIHEDGIDCNGLCGGELEFDCNGDCGGTAEILTYWYDTDNDGLGAGESTDFCDAEVPNGWVLNNNDEHPDCDENYYDCNEDCGGFAQLDSCGVCSGGNSEHDADSDQDCNGVCFGVSELGECGECNGTGIDEGECDCAGNIEDCAGVCGGTTETDDCYGTDIDGNIFQNVQIGSQLWMAENLKVTHYKDGDVIPTGYSNEEWGSLTTGAYAIYDDDESNVEIYGNLYNWFAVSNPSGICPGGWHILDENDYSVLVNYLKGEAVAGGKMKEAGLEHWSSPNYGATNESGFTGLPAGKRYANSGNYVEIEIFTYFWGIDGWVHPDNSQRGYYFGLFHSGEMTSYQSNYARQGNSVRCIKD